MRRCRYDGAGDDQAPFDLDAARRLRGLWAMINRPPAEDDPVTVDDDLVRRLNVPAACRPAADAAGRNSRRRRSAP